MGGTMKFVIGSLDVNKRSETKGKVREHLSTDIVATFATGIAMVVVEFFVEEHWEEYIRKPRKGYVQYTTERITRTRQLAVPAIVFKHDVNDRERLVEYHLAWMATMSEPSLSQRALRVLLSKRLASCPIFSKFLQELGGPLCTAVINMEGA